MDADYIKIKLFWAGWHEEQAAQIRVNLESVRGLRRRRQLLQALAHEITTAQKERAKAFAEIDSGKQ